MANNSPFEIAIVISIILLIASTAFGIVAPSLGVKGAGDSPLFPSFPDLNVQGNLSATYPFSETHQIYVGQTVKFTAFNPDKQVILGAGLLGAGEFEVQRYGTFVIIPSWFKEPITTVSGNVVSSNGIVSKFMRAQDVVNNFNGTYSTFIVDNGNNQFMCWMLFSPLPGYSSMEHSWNVGHGFTVWMYGYAYQTPAWNDQLVAYLTWFGSILAYFVYFAGYILQTSGLMINFLSLGFIPPAIGGAIILIIALVFIGSVLMYIRGIGGGGSK